MVKSNTIIHGPVLAELKKLPGESIDMVITSPPYWSLRDYGKAPETIWDEKSGCQHQFGKTLIKRKTGGGPKAQVTYHKNGVGHYTNQSRFCQLCNAWKDQLGLEPTFELYIKHLLDIFSEIKRVLKPTGSCWVCACQTEVGPL